MPFDIMHFIFEMTIRASNFTKQYIFSPATFLECFKTLKGTVPLDFGCWDLGQISILSWIMINGIKYQNKTPSVHCSSTSKKKKLFTRLWLRNYKGLKCKSYSRYCWYVVSSPEVYLGPCQLSLMVHFSKNTEVVAKSWVKK